VGEKDAAARTLDRQCKNMQVVKWQIVRAINRLRRVKARCGMDEMRNKKA
jgi:hypothetical protein